MGWGEVVNSLWMELQCFAPHSKMQNTYVSKIEWLSLVSTYSLLNIYILNYILNILALLFTLSKLAVVLAMKVGFSFLLFHGFYFFGLLLFSEWLV